RSFSGGNSPAQTRSFAAPQARSFSGGAQAHASSGGGGSRSGGGGGGRGVAADAGKRRSRGTQRAGEKSPALTLFVSLSWTTNLPVDCRRPVRAGRRSLQFAPALRRAPVPAPSQPSLLAVQDSAAARATPPIASPGSRRAPAALPPHPPAPGPRRFCAGDRPLRPRMAPAATPCPLRTTPRRRFPTLPGPGPPPHIAVACPQEMTRPASGHHLLRWPC